MSLEYVSMSFYLNVSIFSDNTLYLLMGDGWRVDNGREFLSLRSKRPGRPLFRRLNHFIFVCVGRYIFDFLDHANMGDDALAAFELEHELGLDKARRNALTAPPGQSPSSSSSLSLAGDGTITRQMRRAKEKEEKKKKERGPSRGFHRGA